MRSFGKMFGGSTSTQLISIFLVLMATTQMNLIGQDLPERGLVRSGNKNFDKGEYAESIEKYSEALKHAPDSYEGRYNLATALFKSGNVDQAKEIMEPMSQDSLLSSELRAELLYNLGNIAFEGEELEQALELYKSSLRLNPSDEQAKFNYAYTKRLLEQQQEQEQEQDGEDEQDEQEQQQDEQDGDGEQEQDDEQQEQEQEQNGDGEQQEQEQEQSPQSSMSEQQAEQILDAIQAQEDKTQDKLEREEANGVLVRGAKNW